MNKFFVILFHTYLNRLKSKSFIITTLVTAFLIIGVTNLQNIITFFDQQDGPSQVAVIDKSGGLFEPLKEQLHPFEEEVVLIKHEKPEEQAQRAVEQGIFDGYLILYLDEHDLPAGIYKANIVAEQLVPTQIEQALQQVKIGLATTQIGLDPNELSKVYSPVPFERVALMEHAKTEAELNQARFLVYILLFVIYFSVIFYGNMIAMEVATEKSSRVMEILISSVSPVKQMFGKIFGVALLGLTQYAILLTIGFLSARRNLATSMMEEEVSVFAGINDIPVMTIAYAIIFFLLGYLLYATLAAMLGSLVSRIEDVNQMITPLNLLIIAAFMIAIFGLGNPESTIITVTSYIPFFTPMIMFLRVGMLHLPIWEIMLSFVILIGTTIVFAFIGARVYRGGVLLYGKSSSLKDLKRAFTLTKKEK